LFIETSYLFENQAFENEPVFKISNQPTQGEVINKENRLGTQQFG